MAAPNDKPKGTNDGLDLEEPDIDTADNVQDDHTLVRDWSLIKGRGGATKREGGGHVKFYPYEKGGRKKYQPC